MVVNEYWMYQGRQYHQWFGHGTAPNEDTASGHPATAGLFDALSVGRRIDYAATSVIGHAPQRDRAMGDPAREIRQGTAEVRHRCLVWRVGAKPEYLS